jgi:ABC-2 type transport system ATP-binding protein
MTRPIVEFQNVCKTYRTGLLHRRTVHALRDVSFTISRGCVFALMGPNQSGKTTLVKTLLSICRPTSGTILRLGRSTFDCSTLAHIGYMHENSAFPSYLTAQALLSYYGGLSLLSGREISERIPRLLEEFGLDDRASEPIACFSRGMLERLALAQSLINDPELLVLDEPGEGMDLSARDLLHRVILRRKRQGKTVILVTHNMDDVRELCDEGAGLRGGKLAFCGPLAKMIGQPSVETGAAALKDALNPIYAGAAS